MITEVKLRKMIAKAEEQLRAIGYKNKPVRNIRFYNAKTTYAQVWYDTGDLDFSNYFVNAPDVLVQATIMHELIHLIPGMVHGHGKGWKRVAAEVNKAYPQYNISRLGSQSSEITADWPLRKIAEMQRNAPYKLIMCPKCGKAYRVKNTSDMLKNIQNCRCNSCGASFED